MLGLCVLLHVPCLFHTWFMYIIMGVGPYAVLPYGHRNEDVFSERRQWLVLFY